MCATHWKDLQIPLSGQLLLIVVFVEGVDAVRSTHTHAIPAKVSHEMCTHRQMGDQGLRKKGARLEKGVLFCLLILRHLFSFCPKRKEMTGRRRSCTRLAFAATFSRAIDHTVRQRDLFSPLTCITSLRFIRGDRGGDPVPSIESEEGFVRVTDSHTTGTTGKTKGWKTLRSCAAVSSSQSSDHTQPRLPRRSRNSGTELCLF